jgi:hypothetical protein
MTAPSHESVAVIEPLAVGIAMTILTVVIHALALRSILGFVRYQRLHGRAGVTFWEDVIIVAGAVLVAFSAHLAEIAAWGFPFYRTGEFPDFAAAFYHSAINYTTLGNEPPIASAAWKFLGPLEAADGMLMFGVTTAVIFAVIQRLMEARLGGSIH